MINTRSSWSILNEINAEEAELEAMRVELQKLAAYVSGLTTAKSLLYWIPNELKAGLKANIKKGIQGDAGVSLASRVQKRVDLLKESEEELKEAIKKGNENITDLQNEVYKKGGYIVRLRREYSIALAHENSD